MVSLQLLRQEIQPTGQPKTTSRAPRQAKADQDEGRQICSQGQGRSGRGAKAHSPTEQEAKGRASRLSCLLFCTRRLEFTFFCFAAFNFSCNNCFVVQHTPYSIPHHRRRTQMCYASKRHFGWHGFCFFFFPFFFSMISFVHCNTATLHCIPSSRAFGGLSYLTYLMCEISRERERAGSPIRRPCINRMYCNKLVQQPRATIYQEAQWQ